MTTDLQFWTQQNDLALDTIMQGVWALLLSRYSGEHDVVFGIATSDSSITLPMRVQVAPDEWLLPWLKTLQAKQVEVRQYEHTPLVQIQEWSKVPRELPLFESILLFESTSGAVNFQDHGENWKRCDFQQHESTHYPLKVTVTARSEISICILYDPTRFDDTTISRMVGHYTMLLEAIIANPMQRLADIPLLTATEWQQQVVEWNQTRADYSFEHCLHQLVETQVERTPDHIAVGFGGEQLSYRELNRRANRLAHRLLQLGVEPDVIVGLCAERSLEMLIGLLAVLKAGGAYMPLDPAYPKERLTYMLQDAQTSLVLAQKRFAEVLPDELTMVLLDSEDGVDAHEYEDNPAIDVMPHHLAYVIYTSGWTGQPKGTLIEHRAICNNLLWMQRDWPLGSNDCLLQKTPFTFDVSVKEFFWPLMAGARLVIARPGGHQDPAYLQELIVQAGITVTHFVPSMLHVFLAQPGVEACRSLRLVMCGAEALSVSLQERFFRLLSADLLHLYGPTEAAIAVTGWLCERGVQRERVPLGGPMPNVQIYLLDSHLQPVPIGVPGELHIGGAALARGYLNRPAETAEKFSPHPFSQEPGARLYRTGDLARYLPDGNLEFLGRIDQQVKVRGLRVELGEIEATLKRHPGVRESVVLAREDIPGDKRLVAYVVPNKGQAPTATKLRTFLQDKLPEYMVPSSFMLLEVLPLSTNGKVDRQALPAPNHIRPDLQRAYTAPRTPTEEQLATIWCRALSFEQVGVYDNFFELGGDSMLGIQVVARANQVGLRLTAKQIFEHQTIAELAAVAGTAPTIQAEQGVIMGPVPLTPIQRWFFGRDVTEPHHYNDAMLLTVRQALNPALLERAVQELLMQHDALRLRYRRGVTDWEQIAAAPDRGVVFSQEDLSALLETEQEPAMDAVIIEMHTSLNLSEGPLLRVVLFDLGPHKPDRLLVIIHHLLVDGISWRILLEDLQMIYEQLSRGEVVQLPPKTTSFKRWAERLTEYAQSATLEQELHTWLAESRKPVLQLPVDNPGGANTVAYARTVSVSLSVEETRALLQVVPEAYHTQINDVLLTVLAQAFRQWTGEEAVLIDLEGHGREPIFEDVDLSRTVGWFTTIFPVRLELAEALAPGTALKSIKERLRRIPNRGLGYGVLRYLSRNAEVVKQLRALPQSEISFNYLGQFDQVLPDSSPFGWAKESIGPVYSLKGKRSHLLKINGIITGGRLQLLWEFSEGVHQRATIEHLAQAFIEALRTLITHCQSAEAGGYTPSDFPLARLDQQTIDLLLGTDRNIEDVYPLSPMQQGLLFHTLYAPQSGVYLVQLICTLCEDLNISAFRCAWQQMLDRHPILRTAFIWEGLDKPLQVVCQQIKLPLEEHDWREYATVAQQQQLEVFLQADRAQGFNLSQAPLMRATLFHLAENTYQFVWSLHHMLLDGWCFPHVLKELFAFYGACCREESLHLECPRPYRDYIVWLEQQDLSQAEAFWRQVLKGFTVPTPLGPHGASSSLLSQSQQQYASQQITLAPSVTTALRFWAQQNDLTLNTIIQGVWALLLSRYSGEHDVVFGATSSGRSAALIGIESMVGVFINTLPVRVQVAPKEQLLRWLKALQAQQSEAREYEHTPLIQIQEWSDVTRGLPLFESILLFESMPWVATLQTHESSWSQQDVKLREQTHYPLTVIATSGPELSLQIIYDCTRFDSATITRMLGHCKTMLEAIAANPAQHIANLPLLTAAEHYQVVEWNSTQVEYSERLCIHELFEAQVERTPDTIAVVFAEKQLTYRELNQRANQLAHYLQTLGVQPNVLVGLCVERSIDMVVGLLGILKAGGAYVPLDPTSPPERLSFMLEDSQVPVLLTQQSLATRLPSQGTRLVCLDTDTAVFRQQSQSEPTCAITAEDLVYVIYTSGSTGRPKGVQITHKSLLNLVYWHQRAFAVTASDRATQVASPAFDATGWELWPYLTIGASVYLPDEETRLTPARLRDWLLEQRISITFLPTALAESIMALQWPKTCSLRYLLTGADKLQHYPSPRLPFTLINNYGPTEATVVTTSGCVPPTEHPDESPSIGRPIANMQVYILDEHLQQVPIGEVGELHIGGVGLAHGYHQRPDLTAERFIPDPFGSEPGARLYKTGDLARYLADGNIEYLGRLDYQVKIRGNRIELGEIETALAEHPAVQGLVVLAREDKPDDKRLVAYLVPDQQYAFPVRQLLRLEKGGLLTSEQQYELPNGMIIAHQNKNETDFLYQEIFEEHGYKGHGITLHEGDCIFDVGANIGLFTLFVGQRCKDAVIYAFEPIPAIFEVLRINAELYGLHLKLFECGLSNEAKSETFTYYPHVSILSGRFADIGQEREVVKSFLFNQQQKGASEAALSSEALDELVTKRLTSEHITCQLKTVSDVIRENTVEQIDLLKVDVEKSELDVLAGIQQDDWQKIKQIVVEAYDIDGRLEQITVMLKSHGYNVTVEQDALLKNTGLYKIYAIRPSKDSVFASEITAKQDYEVRWTWSSPNLLMNDVRSYLKERLPDYMMPSAFVLLDALPLTPNGKVDRRALPAPNRASSHLQDTFIAPRDVLELQLTRIWEALLGVSPIGVTDNFFDLGGHSLLAVRLMAEIHTQFGYALPLSTLFRGATIEHLASILHRQVDPSPRTPLVALQRNGSKRPFFCIHPIGGSVFAFANLARHLGPDHSFYALQASGLDGEQEPYTDLKAMAAHYIGAIRSVQLHGPYLLGGWSFGGIVAFEIAQQLCEQDDASGNVALLALLDCQVPSHDERAVADDAALVARFARDLGNSFATDVQVSYNAIRQLRPDDQWSYVLKKVRSLNLLPPEVGVSQIRNLFQVFKANATALLNYTPQVYPGRLTLFKASEQYINGHQDTAMNWSELAIGGVETHMISGNHYTMMREPYVQVLANHLRHCLHEAYIGSLR